MSKKEIYWLIGTVFFVLILNLTIFGIDGFKSESFTDINIHDTYFVIANFRFILISIVFVFFCIYLIRAIRYNFKNLTINLILIIAIVLLSILVNKISFFIDSIIQQQTTGWTIYPPLGADEIEHEVKSKTHYLDVFSNIIYVIQIGLLILLAYCGFKTGRNYN